MTATGGARNTPAFNGGHFSEDALQVMALQGPGKRSFVFTDDGVAFSSRFDGGSMAQVARVNTNEYHVTIPEDASTSGVSTGYTTWFYFEVMVTSRAPEALHDAGKPTQPGTGGERKTGSMRELTLVLTNMNNQRGLFSNGYTVMYAVMDASSDASDNDADNDDQVELFFENERQWMRLATPIDVEKYSQLKTNVCRNSNEAEHGDTGASGCLDDDNVATPASTTTTTTSTKPKSETKMKISFTHHTQFPQERVRFAFCYPYTYTKIQRQLNAHDRNNPPTGSIYLDRDVLTYSLGGLPIELITISSRDWMLDDDEPSIPGLYPGLWRERAQAFDLTKKKTVFITARVHPGETPASFMLDGMLRLLLHATDENAVCLRRHFVFKIIPVLNPDGVCQGYYRTDSRGVNLNRVYESPELASEPAIYATKALLLQTVERYGQPRARTNVVYLDLHAHANHRGCFVYGNSLLPPPTEERKAKASDLERQVQTQLYAKLVGLHCPFFDYGACSFDAENMSRHDARNNNNATTSREGCSRVALFRATDLTYVYTIECNYNEGRRRLESSAKSTPQRAKPETTNGASSDKVYRHAVPIGGRLFLKYTPAEWIDVGVGSLLAVLDLFQLTPARASCSAAIAQSSYRTHDGVKKSILSDLKAAQFLDNSSSTSATATLGKSPGTSTRALLVRKTSAPTDTPQRTTKPPSSSASSTSSSARSLVSKY